LAFGTFATGITITNIAIFEIIEWAVALISGRRFRPTTARTFGLSVAVLSIVTVLGYGLTQVHHVASDETDTIPEIVGSYMGYMRTSPLQKLERFAGAIGSAVSPSVPVTRPLDLVTPTPISFGFALKTVPGIFSTANPAGLASFLCVLFGGIMMTRKGGPVRSVALIAAGLLGFNLVFRSVWGT
jgi:hypothetical protein